MAAVARMPKAQVGSASGQGLSHHCDRNPWIVPWVAPITDTGVVGCGIDKGPVRVVSCWALEPEHWLQSIGEEFHLCPQAPGAVETVMEDEYGLG
jgi:hypothetical protein